MLSFRDFLSPTTYVLKSFSALSHPSTSVRGSVFQEAAVLGRPKRVFVLHSQSPSMNPSNSSDDLLLPAYKEEVISSYPWGAVDLEILAKLRSGAFPIVEIRQYSVKPESFEVILHL